MPGSAEAAALAPHRIVWLPAPAPDPPSRFPGINPEGEAGQHRHCKQETKPAAQEDSGPGIDPPEHGVWLLLVRFEHWFGLTCRDAQPLPKWWAIGGERAFGCIEKQLHFPPLDRRDQHRLGNPPRLAAGGQEIESGGLEALFLDLLQEPEMPMIAAALQAFLEQAVDCIAPAAQQPAAPAESVLTPPGPEGQEGTMPKNALEQLVPMIAAVPGDKLSNGGFVMTPCPKPFEKFLGRIDEELALGGKRPVEEDEERRDQETSADDHEPVKKPAPDPESRDRTEGACHADQPASAAPPPSTAARARRSSSEL